LYRSNNKNCINQQSTNQVRRCPSLLQLSVHKGLPPKMAWFQETLGLSSEALGRVVLTCPALLTYATYSVNAKVRDHAPTVRDSCFI